MRVPFVVLDVVDKARLLGRHQWMLRSTMVAGAFLVPLAARLTDRGPGVTTTLLTLLVAVWAAVRPDSTRPAVLIGGLLVLWLVTVDDPSSGWSLLGALGVLAVHASASYAADSPAGARGTSATHRRWAGQAGVVAAATCVVWALTQALQGLDAEGRVVVTAAALIGAAMTAAVLTWRSAASGPGG
jgi:hypothetical protein